MITTRQTLQHSALLAIGLLALTGSPALALDYVFSDLGTITGPFAGTQSEPRYINNQGQVVISATNHYLYSAGTYTRYQSLPGGKEVQVGNVNDLGHTAGWIYLGEEADANIPVRYDGAVPTPLQVLGGGTQAHHTVARSINNHDQLVGEVGSNDHGIIRPVRWDGTAVTDLGTLGGTSGTANDINDAGAIVGESHTPNDASLHATHWNGSTITDLGSLGGYSAASGINEAGQIVGYSYVDVENTTYSAVKWLSQADAPLDLPSLPGTYDDMAIQLNNVGQVVGYSMVDGVESAATLWDGDQVIDLNDFLPAELATSGWRLTHAADINDHGVIVGIAKNGDVVAGFQLTPVPVPTAVWLFGSSLAGLPGLARRRSASGG